MLLDDWQKEFIEYKGDKILVAGRQTGKSEAQAYDNAEFAAQNPGTNTLIISKTERQSQELLIKVVQFLQEFYPKMIGTGEYKPLKNTVWIVHPGGTRKKPIVSRVMCLPVGLAGEGIRGYTIHKLSVDEAQLPPDDVFTAVLPMLATTGGKISLTGTPQGKKGFFWSAYENKQGLFKVFHINSEEVANTRPISPTWPEWRKKDFLDFLAKMKDMMSGKRYAQEFLGQFIEDLDQVFSDKLIKECCILKEEDVKTGERYVFGGDIGRTVDPSTFQTLRVSTSPIRHISNIVRRDIKITETTDLIIDLNKKFNYVKIGLDGGGLGAGVVDILLREPGIRPKVVDLNNSSREVEFVPFAERLPKKKTLLKELMYFNLLAMMEKGRIFLLDDDEVKTSLKSCQMEWKEGRDDVIIFGNDTHITEGLIRAAWLAKNKALNLSVVY